MAGQPQENEGSVRLFVVGGPADDKYLGAWEEKGATLPPHGKLRWAAEYGVHGGR